MQKRVFNLALCCCSLVTGGIIYIIFRPDTYISDLFDNIFIVAKLRNSVCLANCGFLKYYFPDFLWGFSLTCGLIAILSKIYICGIIAFISGFVWEMLQLFDITSGVCDFLDILMYLCAVILAVIVNSRSFRNEKIN